MNEITQAAQTALIELLEKAKLKKGSLFLVGCSTSEITGHTIGSASSSEAAVALWEGLSPLLSQRGIYLAVQCCEHLNRAVVLEAEAAEKFGLTPVNVVPAPNAGGAFATLAYNRFQDPVMVEGVQAAAGMDVGDVLIGMNLAAVAVPVRVSVKSIGKAHLTCARTRPKFIGGARAQYDERLL